MFLLNLSLQSGVTDKFLFLNSVELPLLLIKVPKYFIDVPTPWKTKIITTYLYVDPDLNPPSPLPPWGVGCAMFVVRTAKGV